MESKESPSKNRLLRALPCALSIATWLGVVAITARSILTGEYGDAWIILGAVLIMDAVRNFGEFAASKEWIKPESEQMALSLAVGWIVGVLFLWGLGRALIPAEIAGDFRIMAIFIIALMAISLINWACKFKLSPKHDQPLPK